ncbi:hypothetical protein JCM3765_007031 [Sporobolomyces pararoseus]
MTYQRSTGIKELLFLRAKFNDLVDSLVDAEIELPSASDPSAYFPPPRPELPKIIALCEQIQALLGGPTYTLNQAFLFHIPSCLRVAIDARVEETLREAAEQGKSALHVKVIAKSSSICPEKLARVLRLLAARHIFREVGLDTFARNRCSSALDTGKSVAELKAYPDLAYVDTSGFAALLAHTADECFKASAYLSETVLSPSTSFSYDIRAAPFGMAYGNGITIFEHFSKKRNAHFLARFSSAVKFAGTAFSGGEDSILCGFPFSKLKDQAVVVDVGAGIGQVSLTISETYPQVRVVVQDLADVIREAKPFWKASAPRDIESGRVTLMDYDFFEEQPVRRADVYILRAIVHDWADHDAVRILERIAEAASSHSSLIVVEQSYNFLCSPNPFPVPSLLPYFMDLQMMVAVNALERTQPQYEALALKAGWKLEKVWKTGKDGYDGPYRHYEFKLSPERVRANRKRDEKVLNGGTSSYPHSNGNGYGYGDEEKELVKSMRSTGLVAMRGNGSSSSSRSSDSNGYRHDLP